MNCEQKNRMIEREHTNCAREKENTQVLKEN